MMKLNNNLNGWQRGWIVCSGLYIGVLVVLVVMKGRPFEGGLLANIGGGLLAIGAPPALLGLVGFTAAWVVRGFRKHGVRGGGAWFRVWIVLSSLWLLPASIFLVQDIGDEVHRFKVLSSLAESDGVFRAYRNRNDQSIELYAVASDGRHFDLGAVSSEKATGILSKSNFDREQQSWEIASTSAAAILRRPNSLVLGLTRAFAIWLAPPFLLYLVACALAWTYAGFKGSSVAQPPPNLRMEQPAASKNDES